MPDEGRTGESAAGRGGASPFEAIRGPAAVAGYVAFYATFALVFVCAFFRAFGHPLAMTLFALFGLTIVGAVVVNYESALGSFRTRRAAAGMSVALAVASGFVILVAANWLLFRHYWSWDITEDRRFTLSEQTEKWLAKLEEGKQALEIVTFLAYQPSQRSPLPRDYKRQTTELLKLYERSPLISVTNTDPLRERAKTIAAAEKLGMKAGAHPDETVVLRYGEKRKDVGIRVIFDMPPPNPRGPVRGQAIFNGEDAITSAIRDLLDEKARRVYFVIGHGERTSGYGPGNYGAVADQLRGMNFVIEDVDLAQKGRVPEDTSVLVVAGPGRRIPDDERASIEAYLGRGGRLIVMLEYQGKGAGGALSGLEGTLEDYGIKAHRDARAAMMGRGRHVVLDRIVGLPDKYSEISKSLSGYKALFYTACVLQVTAAKKTGYQTHRVAEGTDGSWGERNASQSPPRYNEGDDVAGPTLLAAAVGPGEGPDSPREAARIVVFADADFLSNQLVTSRLVRLQYVNADLFLNAVNWMVGRTANIGIAPRERDRRTVVMTPSRRTKLFWGGVVFPAALMIALGIYVWRVRSR